MSEPSSEAKLLEDGIVSDALTVAKPSYGLALIVFLALALAAVIWALKGSIPHRIAGFGEIVPEQGLYGVSSPAAGQIEQVLIQHGASVKKGDLLVRLKQPDITDQILTAQIELEVLKARDSILKSGDDQSLALKTDLNDRERSRINNQIVDTDAEIESLTEKVAQQQVLFEDGIIINSVLFESQDALAQAKVQREEYVENLWSLDIESQEWVLSKDLDEKVIENDIAKLEQDLKNLQELYQRSTEIRSEEDGRLIEMNVSFGDFISKGENILVLERDDQQHDYILDLYLPFTANDRVLEGMLVDVEPYTVDRNLYGWLIGEVTQVSSYITTDAALMDSLENSTLTDQVERNGPVYRVRVKLKLDSNTVSGFAWSNETGPPFALSVGGLSQAYVRVKDKAPIDYLIPIFKEYFE